MDRWLIHRSVRSKPLTFDGLVSQRDGLNSKLNTIVLVLPATTTTTSATTEAKASQVLPPFLQELRKGFQQQNSNHDAQCSSCGTLSEVLEWRVGLKSKLELELMMWKMELILAWSERGVWRNIFVTGLRAEFVPVLGFVQVGVFMLGFQFGVVNLGWSSLCVPVGVFRLGRFVNSWFAFFDGVNLPEVVFMCIFAVGPRSKERVTSGLLVQCQRGKHGQLPMICKQLKPTPESVLRPDQMPVR
jgi:hypothetical protein